MKQGATSRGGRPRTFDREQAVETAMRLFWRHGYEGVSVADLTGAIGIAAPSLYVAFGSKAQLFHEALDRYAERSNGLDLLGFTTAATLQEAVRELLYSGVRAATDPTGETGCMISSGMIAGHPDHQMLVREMAERRDTIRESIVKAVSPWVGDQRAPSLGRYLAAVLQGISIQARDGANASELRAIVDEVTAGLTAVGPQPIVRQ